MAHGGSPEGAHEGVRISQGERKGEQQSASRTPF